MSRHYLLCDGFYSEIPIGIGFLLNDVSKYIDSSKFRPTEVLELKILGIEET